MGSITTPLQSVTITNPFLSAQPKPLPSISGGRVSANGSVTAALRLSTNRTAGACRLARWMRAHVCAGVVEIDACALMFAICPQLLKHFRTLNDMFARLRRLIGAFSLMHAH